MRKDNTFLPLVLLTILFLVSVVLISRKVKTEVGIDFIFCTRHEEAVVQEQEKVDRKPAFVPVYKWAWDDEDQLLVYFINGNDEDKKSVLTIANEWSRHCRIKFTMTSVRGMAHIRITFDGDRVSSAVGKESMQYATGPTMYLGGTRKAKNQVEFRRLILHEFGHALGLEHEMKNPNIQIPWDSSAVYKYYQDKYKWTKTEVDKNFFERIEIDKKKYYSEFDTSSIMIYAIPPSFTKGKLVVEWPEDLSPTDKLGISTWYPKSSPQ